MKLVISDAHAGLKAAIARVFEATWQRCRVHWIRNALAHVPKGQHTVVAAAIRQAFNQPDKKTAHASEQDRPDILKRRQVWFEAQPDLDPERLVFIDETWAKTNMARTHGRAPRGQRLRVGVPHGHWKTTTVVAGLTLRGMIAPFVLDGPINRDAFEAYVERVLVPELRPGDIVVMDNLSEPQGAEGRERSSRQPAHACSSSRPTVPTSTRSRTPSPSSRRCSARPPNEPSPASGAPSATSSTPSPSRMRQLLRRHLAAIQNDGIEILRKASAYFAAAELDRRSKP